MRPLLWKECQENLKWAALPVLLLGGLLALLGPPNLMDYGALLILGLIAAVFGAVLGFLQVFPESRGDRRALLLHRPISHSRVFLAKATVGVGLYLLALGLPLAGAVAWIATPGHVPAPFRLPMALPWLADVLTGLVYYFAGMLMAQREARWYGSRSLGLFAALLCTFLVWVLPQFWEALLAVAIMGALVGLAAWGSFLAGGAYAPQPRPARAALAATLLAGLLTLGVIVKVFIGGYALGERYEYYYTLDREGRVLLVHWRPGDIRSVTDLQGRQPEALQGKELDSRAIREIEAPASAPVWPKYHGYRDPGRFSLRCRNESSSGDERWFYVADEGCLLGYDGRSRRLIGRCGPDGFVPADRQPQERFHGEPYSSAFLYETESIYYLSFPDGVYAFDFARHTIHRLFTPAEGETVLAAVRWKDEKQKVSRAFVLTDRSVHVVDEAGASLLAAPLAYDRESYGHVRVARLEDPPRFVVWYEPSWYLWADAGKTMPGYLVEYDLAGREVARREVPPRPLEQSPYVQALFGLATPPAEAAVIARATRDATAEARRAQGSEIPPVLFFLAVPTRFFIPGAGVNMTPAGGVVVAYRALILVSALACALANFLLAPRYAFSRARCIGWSVCGLLFGPAGLLLLLAVQDWPARVACPKCRKPRVVTREKCEHCGAPHAPPCRPRIFSPGLRFLTLRSTTILCSTICASWRLPPPSHPVLLHLRAAAFEPFHVP
jgi:hypothetical protein